ncbi:hypothetical protein B566_EDAN007559 [Ephemera danica]|nr:hypothetical protein B566_EDAN007559 [Ephemera danica]
MIASIALIVNAQPLSSNNEKEPNLALVMVDLNDPKYGKSMLPDMQNMTGAMDTLKLSPREEQVVGEILEKALINKVEEMGLLPEEVTEPPRRHQGFGQEFYRGLGGR